ncbi:hypothetical protein VK792_09615 [Mesobacterium sp. TK19101]|uniref:Uncharacterized protein n=1 Tax=Mesobacterium hydrothermale TaxID=3111907 RepID=A0ABU6HGF8_9RHOB|nr:hypothetical protein [Mesobacterium sp. TK19101]MEC3861540.1 hypothetical protein [Mesobacterium sp. TK19101]
MIVVVGLIVAFVLLVLFTNRDTRLCRWREYPGSGDSDWRCVHCGAHTTGPRGSPPQRCLRPRA